MSHETAVETISGEISPEQAARALKQLSALLDAADEPTATLANASALLNELLGGINWVGFYLRRGNTLHLGPFHGKSACTMIPIGKGVCGLAAQERRTIVVDDVSSFDDYITCDSATRSEVVVPLILDNDLIGVLDVDGSRFGRFGASEKGFFEELAKIYMYSITGQL